MTELFTTNNIDFESIKSSLRDHLRTTDTFKDYNFEGSALSMILDILAYNTQYQAFYNNMVINEMFLDTAVSPESVNSIAKSLGYRPSSMTTAMAEIDIELPQGSGEYGLGSYLPANVSFTSIGGGKAYTFQTLEPTLVTSDDPPQLTGVKIYEGDFKSSQFVYDSSNNNNQFVIPEKNVDITTIKVNVQAGIGSVDGYSDNWRRADTLLSVDGLDKVYFVQKNREGYYEIYFGDGVVGKKLDNGQLIYITYLISSGENANGIGENDEEGNRTFASPGFIDDIIVTSPAQGGSPPESIESIKINASLAYQAQNRAVTTTDYKAIIQEQFPSLESVSVYGGEEENPPQYGRVMIAIKPFSGKFITEATKRNIESTLKESKGVIGVSPVVIDPDYLYIRLNTNTKYQSTKLGIPKDALKVTIDTLLSNFVDLNLDKFEQNLYRSKIQTLVDDVDTSILGSNVEITLEKRIVPNFDQSATYSTSFTNPIYNPHVGHIPVISSNKFTFVDGSGIPRTGTFRDDGAGNIVVVDDMGSSLKTDAGKIDYTSGLLTLSRIYITDIEGLLPYISIRAKPNNADILSPRNTIITYDKTDPTAIQIVLNDIDNHGQG